MSGEPKTLTLTLEEAMCRLYNAGWNLVAVPAWRRTTAHSWELESKTDWREGFATWPEAVSFALGVPVVARDEAAELRAALVGVGDTLDLIGACVVEVPPSSDAYADANEILGLLSAAESILHKALRLPELRRLAGGESEK